MDFFGKYKQLCEQNGSSPNAIGKKLGFSSGSITSWKNGTTPKFETRLKIADFFHVPIAVFLTDRERNEFGLKEDRSEIFLDNGSAKLDLAKMLQSAPGLMFNGTPLSDRDREQVLKAIKIAMELSEKE